METPNHNHYDWLVYRTWNKLNEDIEICILTTRGHLLSRLTKDDIRLSLKKWGSQHYKQIPGLRRYRTENRAQEKASQLNERHGTTGHKVIREDQI